MVNSADALKTVREATAKSVIEGLIDYLNSNRYVLAFQLGRSFNRFSFHGAQAFVLYAAGMHGEAYSQYAIVKEALEDLAAIIRQFNEFSADQAYAKIEGVRLSLDVYFGRDAHDEDLLELKHRLDILGEEYPTYLWRDWLLNGFEGSRYQVRELLRKIIGPARGQLFELGRLFDEGIRPRNVQRSMFEKPEKLEVVRHRDPNETPEESEQLDEDLRGELAERMPRVGNYLANRMRQVGELPPNLAWSTTCTALLSRLIPGYEPGLAVLNTATAIDRMKQIEQVDCSVRLRLLGYDASERQVPPTGWDEATITRNLWIYDQFRKGTSLKRIRAELGRLAASCGWNRLTSNSRVRDVVQVVAERLFLPPLGPRKPGRPRRSS